MADVYPITLQKFLKFWIGCLALVLLTYNPFGHSYYHWLVEPSNDYFSFKLWVGVSLTIAYIILAWIIGSQLGRVGVVTGVILLLLTIWAVLDEIGEATPMLRQFVVVFCMGTLLAVGLTWPHIRVNLSGIVNKRYLIPKMKYRKRWHWWHWY